MGTALSAFARELGSLSKVIDDDIERRLGQGIRHREAERLAREIPMRTIYRGVAPFIFADLVLLALLAVFPAIALWLPRLLGS